MGRVAYGLYVVQNNRYKLWKRGTTTSTAHSQGPRPLTLCEIKQHNDTSGCHTFHPLSGTLCMSQSTSRDQPPQSEPGQGTHNIRGTNPLQPLFDLAAEPLNIVVINLRRDFNRLVARKRREICLLPSQEVVVAACGYHIPIPR